MNSFDVRQRVARLGWTAALLAVWAWGCSSGGQQAGSDAQLPPDLSMLQSDGGVDAGARDLATAMDLALPLAEGKGQWGQDYFADTSVVVVDPKSGAFFIAGNFSRANFGEGEVTAMGLTDIVLIKYDRTGRREWVRTFGRQYADLMGGLAVAPDGSVAITGSTLADSGTASHDVFVARYSPAGAQLLYTVFASPEIDGGRGIAVAADGSLYVAGGTRGNINYGGGPLGKPEKADATLVHLSSSGAHLFSKRFASAGWGGTTAVAMTQSGDVLISGAAPADTDFGDKPLVTAGDQVGFLARFSATGTLRFARRLGPCPGTCGSDATGLALAANGDAVITGFFHGKVNLGDGEVTSGPDGSNYIARYNTEGVLVQKRILVPTMAGAWPFALALDRDDQILLGGQYEGEIDFGGGKTSGASGNALIAKLTFDSRERWVRRFGSSSSGDAIRSIAIDTNGNILAVGNNLKKQTVLDAVTLNGPGFLVRLSP